MEHFASGETEWAKVSIAFKHILLYRSGSKLHLAVLKLQKSSLGKKLYHKQGSEVGCERVFWGWLLGEP